MDCSAPGQVPARDAAPHPAQGLPVNVRPFWRPARVTVQDAAAASFSLLTQPWLPLRALDGGSVALYSLNDALRQAGTLGPVDSGRPEVDLVLMRLLGAYLRRALPHAGLDLMGEWLEAGAITPASLQALEAYAQAHAPGLDLFGPRPFLQMPLDEAQPGAAKNWRQSAVLLFPDRSPRSNTNPQPHTWSAQQPGHDSFQRTHVLPVHEALWGLLTLRSVATGGLQRSVVYSAPASPLMDAWQVYPRGRTFLQSLAAQLLGTPHREGDAAPWETVQTPQGALAELRRMHAAPDRRPRGPVDCATWASRNARLLPQPGPDGQLVVAQILCDGGDRALGKELGAADPTLLRLPGASEPVSQDEREAAKQAAKAAGTRFAGVAYARVSEARPRPWEVPALLQRFEAPVLRAMRDLEADGAVPPGELRRMLLGVASNQSKVLAIHALSAPRLPRLGAEQGTLARALDLARAHAEECLDALSTHVRHSWQAVGARGVGSEAELLVAAELGQATDALLSALGRGAADQPVAEWLQGLLLDFARDCEQALLRAAAQVWREAQGNERLQLALVQREGALHQGAGRRAAKLRRALGLSETDPADTDPADTDSADTGPAEAASPSGAPAPQEACMTLSPAEVRA